MRKFLEKTELKFVFKISLLLALILFASSLKEKQKGSNSLVQSVSFELPTAVFTNF